MTWPKKAKNVLNLSFFFERLPKHRAKEQCPSFTAGQETICFFFYFFLKLTF